MGTLGGWRLAESPPLLKASRQGKEHAQECATDPGNHVTPRCRGPSLKREGLATCPVGSRGGRRREGNREGCRLLERATARTLSALSPALGMLASPAGETGRPDAVDAVVAIGTTQTGGDEGRSNQWDTFDHTHQDALLPASCHPNTRPFDTSTGDAAGHCRSRSPILKREPALARLRRERFDPANSSRSERPSSGPG